MAANATLAPGDSRVDGTLLVWNRSVARLGLPHLHGLALASSRGHRDPSSYMQLLISEILRVDIGSFWADALTGGIFAVVAVLTLMLNLRDRRREHAAAR